MKQKHVLLNKRAKYALMLILSCLAMLLFTACNRVEEETYEPEKEYSGVANNREEHEAPGVSQADVEQFIPVGAVQISTSHLAANLREEFGDRQDVDFGPPLLNLPRNQAFYIDVNFEASSAIVDNLLAVYVNSELTERVWVNSEILRNDTHPEIPRGHSRIVIRPGLRPVGRVWGSSFNVADFTTTTLPESGERYLHETEDGENWGFLRHFYLVSRMDTYGEMRNRPAVTIFTIEHHLEAPQSEFFITEEGNGGFRWSEVEGAEYYLIIRFDANLRATTVADFIGKTTETTWISQERRYDYGQNYAHVFMMNREFWWMNDVFFSVIAVNSQTHSGFGNLHDGNVITSLLPHVWDWETEPLEAMQLDEGLVFFIHDFGTLPTHRPLVMVNEETVQRRMLYDWERAEIRDIAVAWIDPDLFDQLAKDLGFGEIYDLTLEQWDILTEEWNAMLIDPETGTLNPDIISWRSDELLLISFVIEGTLFYGYMAIANVNHATYRADLSAARTRIEEAAARGGGYISLDLTTVLVEEDLSWLPTGDESLTLLYHPGDRIYANSALSAFLAHNMLAANTLIDLSYFPESGNLEYLWDAFFEAIYQNPLILHVRGARRLPDSDILIVEYRKPADTIFRQQEAIRQIVPEIVAEIISADMSDLEKSMAINSFLVETAEYDFAALESAELHNFRKVDPRYYDSFTAYGILINRVGVCSGYAAAFKLLADAAGLQSIIVTGYLEGFLPHAWNRVNIDGHWHTVDVTNNANPYLYNIFLHLPDEVAAIMLVEDQQFVLNNFLYRYRSNSGSSEYFYITDRFYPIHAIAQALARDIRATGRATLRTDATLCDMQFSVIVMEVRKHLGTSALWGGHMLGVIHLLV